MSQKAVDWFNKQSNAPFVTDPKHLADRSKLLTDQCERENKVCKSHSRKENELERSELTELLVGAVRAKEMWLQANECGDEETCQKEARLRQQGAQARNAMMRRCRVSIDVELTKGDEPGGGTDCGENDGSASTPIHRSGSKKLRRAFYDAHEDELLSIIKWSEERKQDLEDRRLALEERRMHHARELRVTAQAQTSRDAFSAAAAAASSVAQHSATMSLMMELALSTARREKMGCRVRVEKRWEVEYAGESEVAGVLGRTRWFECVRSSLPGALVSVRAGCRVVGATVRLHGRLQHWRLLWRCGAT